MKQLSATYGGLLYLDRALPLLLGQVNLEGIDLNYVVFDSPGDLFRRQCQYAQFEISEMSASTYISMIGQSDDPLSAYPFSFPEIFDTVKSTLTKIQELNLLKTSKASVSDSSNIR